MIEVALTKFWERNIFYKLIEGNKQLSDCMEREKKNKIKHKHAKRIATKTVLSEKKKQSCSGTGSCVCMLWTTMYVYFVDCSTFWTWILLFTWTPSFFRHQNQASTFLSKDVCFQSRNLPIWHSDILCRVKRTGDKRKIWNRVHYRLVLFRFDLILWNVTPNFLFFFSIFIKHTSMFGANKQFYQVIFSRQLNHSIKTKRAREKMIAFWWSVA